jgi:hypothetical protein
MKQMIELLLILTVLVFGFSSLAMAQAPPQEALPGCALAWLAPMIEDLPNNPGTQISQWEHAGDHKGFVFNTRKDDQHVWDKLLEQKIEDPSLLLVDCPTIGVEDLGTYSVGIGAEDHSLNLSTIAWITFNIIAPDTTSLAPLAEICMNGSLNGQPVQTCQRPGTP